MYEQLEILFTNLLGKEFDMSIIKAFLVCLAVMIVYGFLLRPFINWIGGKNGGRFFDITVMILIVCVGIKVLYPDILTEGGYTKSDLDSYYDQGYSDGYDRGEGEGYDKGFIDGSAEGGSSLPEFDSLSSFEDYISNEYSSSFEHGYFASGEIDFFFSNIQTAFFTDCEAFGLEDSIIGVPFAIVDGIFWFCFDCSEIYRINDVYKSVFELRTWYVDDSMDFILVEGS